MSSQIDYVLFDLDGTLCTPFEHQYPTHMLHRPSVRHRAYLYRCYQYVAQSCLSLLPYQVHPLADNILAEYGVSMTFEIKVHVS
jgi:hypothetical protein